MRERESKMDKDAKYQPKIEFIDNPFSLSDGKHSLSYTLSISKKVDEKCYLEMLRIIRVSSLVILNVVLLIY